MSAHSEVLYRAELDLIFVNNLAVGVLDARRWIVSQIRVLVVDDHEAWREFICSVLESRPEFQVAGEASDGLEAVQRAQELKPDLIVLDIGLPKFNGIEAENQLCELVPSAKVLFLSQNRDAEVVRAALSNGAQGYVLKFNAGSELLPAIKAILRGEKFVGSGIRWADFKSQSGDSTQLSL